ncbi:MAG: ABC transporter substrate-binding protein [Nitrospirota bacterium]
MKKIIEFKTAFYAVVLLALIFFIGCKKTKNIQITDFEKHPVYKNYKFSNDEKVIEIGVPTPWASVNHVIEVMKRDEIFKQELKRIGYTVKFYPFMKGEEINYFMKKGLLEGSIIGDMPTLKMASEGHITVMSLFHKGSVSLVSRDIYRVRDLKGKRVAYPYGSIAHYYLLRILKENGMSEGDIHHALMDPDKILNAVKDRTIDAFTTFEPTATVYTKIDPTLHTIHRSFSSYGFFNIRRDYGERHKEAVKAVIAAQIRAIIWLTESDKNINMASRWMAEESAKIVPIPLNKYIKELNIICSEDISGSMNIHSIGLNDDTIRNGGDMSKEFEFLKAIGLIQKDRKWDDVTMHFDTGTALDAIKNIKKPEPAKIIR